MAFLSFLQWLNKSNNIYAALGFGVLMSMVMIAVTLVSCLFGNGPIGIQLAEAHPFCCKIRSENASQKTHSIWPGCVRAQQTSDHRLQSACTVCVILSAIAWLFNHRKKSYFRAGGYCEKPSTSPTSAPTTSINLTTTSTDLVKSDGPHNPSAPSASWAGWSNGTKSVCKAVFSESLSVVLAKLIHGDKRAALPVMSQPAGGGGGGGGVGFVCLL